MVLTSTLLVPAAALLASPLLGGVATGALGLIGSLFGAQSQNKNVQATNRLQYQMQRETNAMQMAMARENNQFQRDLLRENNAFNRQSAIDMFNLEAAYNDPLAQKQRLLAAGINPNVAFSGASTSSGSVTGTAPTAASAGVSPSMPTLGTAQMQVPPSVLSAMFPQIESFTRALANMAQAGLSDSQRKRIGLTMDAELQSMLADAANKRASEAWTKVQTTFEQMYGHAERNSKVRETLTNCYRLYNDAMLSAAKGETEKANKKLAEANERIASINEETLRGQMPFLIKQAEESVNLIKEQQNTQKSQQAANYASASQSRAVADLTEEQRHQLAMMCDDIVAIKTLERAGKDLEVTKLRRTLDAQIAFYVNQGIISEEQIRAIKAEASQREKENSAFWFTYVFDKLERTLKTGAAWIPFAGGSDNNIYTPMWSTSTTR